MTTGGVGGIGAPMGKDLPQALLREWWTWVVGSAGALMALGVAVADGEAVRWSAWLPGTALVAGYVLAFCRARLHLNHRPAEPDVLGKLGPGTSLTLLRGLLVAPLAGLLFLPRLEGAWAWLPAVLYTASDVADYLDGSLARRARHATRLGEVLDMELDGLGLLLAVAVAIHYGQLPVGFLAVGLARYAYQVWTLVWQRLRGRLREIPASMARRAIAGLEMGFVSAALWPITPPSLALWAGWIFAIPFFLSFGRDALVAAGWVDVTSSRYRAVRSALLQVVTRWAPPVMRAALVVVWGPVTWARLGDLPSWSAALAEAGVAQPVLMAAVYAGIQALGLVAVAAGVLGRTASLLLITAHGLAMAALGVTPAGLVGVGLAAALLIVGTGPVSIWSPEGEWLGKRRGGRE